MNDIDDIASELTSAQLLQVHGGGGKLDPGGCAIVLLPLYDGKVAPPGYLEPVRPTGGLGGGVVLGS